MTLLAKSQNRIRSSKEEKEISNHRQSIETAFSCIANLFPRYLRACTEQGFLVKVLCSIPGL